ncbi:hypothetical protein EIP91_007001 [Steccherinum ochraceum]|uniref:F-box domain-containing protein n=1 Tax=Steccherinum ochraceum TaxID=92696 RepID=A0A4R0RUW7_9APHY|nr:hypothetical protein EIP91_007001 [Steccherinum ochraceum]
MQEWQLAQALLHGYNLNSGSKHVASASDSDITTKSPTLSLHLANGELPPCLQVSEILVYIFSYVRDRNDGQATLFAIASSCRTFCDPALDALYRTVPNIATIFRCLPADAWYIEEAPSPVPEYQVVKTIHLKRFLREEDWKSVERNARRVRMVGTGWYLGVSEKWAISDGLFLSMKHRFPPQLLPGEDEQRLFSSVIRMMWSFDKQDEAFYLYTPHLVGDRLVSFMSYATEPPAVPTSPQAVGEAHALLAKRCSQLRKVCTFFEDDEWSGAGDVIGDAMARLALLTTYQVNIPHSLLSAKALCGLPVLKEVVIRLRYVDLVKFVSKIKAGTVFFPSLTGLMMYARELADCAPFWNAVQSERMESIKISVHPPWMQVDDMKSTLETFARWRTSLRAVTLTNFLPTPDEEAQLDAPPARTVLQHVIEADTLLPLTQLPNLTHLSINMRVWIQADDECLHALAQALPKLQQFHLVSIGTPPFIIYPMSTVAAALAFAEHCPRLIELRLELDNTLPPEDIIQKAKDLRTQNHGLKHFEISYSMEIDAHDILDYANFVVNLFPNLVIFNTRCTLPPLDELEDDEEDDEEAAEDRRVTESWTQIQALVRQGGSKKD